MTRSSFTTFPSPGGGNTTFDPTKRNNPRNVLLNRVSFCDKDYATGYLFLKKIGTGYYN